MTQAGRRRTGRLARRFGASAGIGVVLGTVALVAVALVVGIMVRGSGAGVVVERGGDEAPKGAEPAQETEETDGGVEGAMVRVIVVHVDGAVRSPGVYELEEGARVRDAVQAAGGLAEGADTSAMNLAALVEDAQKVHVPRRGEEVTADPNAESEQGESTLINLNTATAEELDELPGVGESTARAIIEDREKNGPFSSPEDLMRVSGIGEKKFERLEAMVCV